MKQILLLFAICSLATLTSCSTTQENSFPKSDYTNAGIPKLPETPEMKSFKESLRHMSLEARSLHKNGAGGSLAKRAEQEYMIMSSKSLLVKAGYSQIDLDISNKNLFRLALKEYIKQSSNYKTY